MGKSDVTNDSEILERAILNGHRLKILKLLRHQNIDVKTVNENGDSVLHLALRNVKSARNEIIEILSIFLNRGVDPNIKNSRQNTVLHLAVARKEKGIIDFLLKYNTAVNVTDYLGNSIAHIFIENEVEQFMKVKKMYGNYSTYCNKRDIAEKESVSFVKWLLSRGFDFDHKNEMGQSALHWAVEYNFQHILPVLLRHSNDINFLSECEKRTILHSFIIASNGKESFKRLVNCFEPRIVMENQWCEFIPKYRIPSERFSKRYAIEIVKIMLERGVSVDHVDEWGLTALDMAIDAKEDMDMVELLLDRFTKVKDKCGVSLLHELFAKAMWGHADIEYYSKILRALIAEGADLNSEDEHGMALVHYAAKKENLRAVEFLKRNGADLSAVNEKGQNALFWLSYNFSCDKVSDDEQHALFNLLIDGGCNVNARDNSGKTPLHWAIENAKMTVVRNLLGAGAEINSHENDGQKTPLHLTVNQGDLKMVELLLHHGADVNSIDSCNGSPLHIAVKQGHLKMTELLLDHGADIDSKDIYGGRPLHQAVKRGLLEMVKFLLDKGADVNSKDSCGDRPLHLAATLKSDRSMPEMLLRRGALVNARNKEGNSALVETIQHGNIDCMKELLTNGADINDKCVAQSLSSFVESTEAQYLLKHWIKLKVAKLSCAEEYEAFVKIEEYQQLHEDCLREIEILKSTFIDSHTTLYTWMHMNRDRRCIHSHNQKLLNLVYSPTLEEQFPQYSILIISYYRGTVARKTQLEPAKEVWLKLTKIHLPDICLECIFAYLNDGDLADIAGINESDIQNKKKLPISFDERVCTDSVRV